MPLYQVGDIIERQIEQMWFAAVVESVNLTRRSLKLRYLDDGNIEDGVPMVDCRRNEDDSESKNGTGNYESKGFDSKWESKHSEVHAGDTKGTCVSKDKQLLKPLAGLIEDDAHERDQQIPVAKIHKDSDTEDAIILHGEEAAMAAGGGLRALRFLKDKR